VVLIAVDPNVADARVGALILRRGGRVKIRKARKADLPAVERLLSSSNLPVDGVRDHFADFIVAEGTDGIEGAVGLEKYESVALLRSAVVAPECRGSGVGRRLVEQVLERAEEDGIDELYLLTTTAEKYFPRFGFETTTRTAVPNELKASAEFRGACPDTAVVMKRRLGTSRARA
jgi:N-acetylglutamate synthase-like GNAT family acetyltransferase